MFIIDVWNKINYFRTVNIKYYYKNIPIKTVNYNYHTLHVSAPCCIHHRLRKTKNKIQQVTLTILRPQSKDSYIKTLKYKKLKTWNYIEQRISIKTLQNQFTLDFEQTTLHLDRICDEKLKNPCKYCLNVNKTKLCALKFNTFRSGL